MALNLGELSVNALLIIFWVSAACHQAAARNLDEAATTTMSLRHEQWMARHGRTYGSVAEKERRFQIFKNNVEAIERFNRAGNRTYTLGVNKFTDLTSQEFKTYYTGSKAPTGLPSTTPFKYENVSAAEVPQSVDWRSKAVTPIKDQGQCGCCWVFASVAAIEGIHQIKTGELVSLSDQQVLDCNGKYGCPGGTIEQALTYAVQNQGLTTDSAYPYKEAEGTCSATRTSISATVTGYEKVPANNEQALQAAVANQPVAVRVDPTMLQSYQGGILSNCRGPQLSHDIAAVGYGTNEAGIKYWIFKNSWGSGWGENGFVRIQKDIADPKGMCGIAMGAWYPTA